MKLSGNKKRKKPEAADQPAKTAGKGAKAAVIATLAAAAVVIGGAGAGVAYVNQIDTIFPNVRLDGEEIGGLSLNETMALLEEKGYTGAADSAVTVELPLDVSLTVRTDEVCTETPVADIAKMAYDACKGGSAVGNALTYLRCRTGGMELQSERAITVDQSAVQAKVEAAAKEVQLALLSSDLKIGETSISVVKGAAGVTVDTERLTEQIVQAFEEHNYSTIQYDAEIQADEALDVESLYNTVFTEKADAHMNEEFEVVPETVGVSFDMDQARQLWENASYGETVEIPLILDQPEVTAESLQNILFRDKLSTMSTSLSGSTSNRINNVKKAADSINGKILMPGEEFDYNKALGKRTAENGYLPAGAYSGGQVVQEYGGGICQVSSTLYYCCLYANLKITSRTCHYFPVSYLPAGLDATVSWGGPEYRFVNDRDYPIKIMAYVNEKNTTVTVELWGTDVDGSYVEMTYGTWTVFDTKYPTVAIGYKARTYRTVYAADGTQISRREEANSFYHYHDENIQWPEEEPQPSETPAPTETPAATETPAPTEAPQPSESPAPTEAPQPSESPAQTEAPQPSETPAPTQTPDAELPPNETPVPVTEDTGTTPEPLAPLGE